MRKSDVERPVFIVSSGRSGTTLLRTMLNAGNQLHIPHESDFIARAYPHYKHSVDMGEADYELVLSLFRRTSQNAGWGLPPDYLLRYLKKLSPTTFKDVNVGIVQSYLDFHGLQSVRWGIKAPVLIASIGRILELFPAAKIVHLVRDGRDVYLSYRAVHKSPDVASFGPGSVVSSALYWIDGLRRIEKFERRVFELRYEDLVMKPREELERLCGYLEVPYDAVMHTSYLKAKGNKDAVLSEHRSTIHAKIADGVDSTNTKKYLTKMSRMERFVFEFFASPYLKKYQYDIEFPVLNCICFSPARRIAYLAARMFNTYRYWRRDRVALRDAMRMLDR